jgi:hypothetical protein
MSLAEWLRRRWPIHRRPVSVFIALAMLLRSRRSSCRVRGLAAVPAVVLRPVRALAPGAVDDEQAGRAGVALDSRRGVGRAADLRAEDLDRIGAAAAHRQPLALQTDFHYYYDAAVRFSEPRGRLYLPGDDVIAGFAYPPPAILPFMWLSGWPLGTALLAFTIASYLVLFVALQQWIGCLKRHGFGADRRTTIALMLIAFALGPTYMNAIFGQVNAFVWHARSHSSAWRRRQRSRPRWCWPSACG